MIKDQKNGRMAAITKVGDYESPVGAKPVYQSSI